MGLEVITVKAGISKSDLRGGFVDGDGNSVDIGLLQPFAIPNVGVLYGESSVIKWISERLTELSHFEADAAMRNDDVFESALEDAQI